MYQSRLAAAGQQRAWEELLLGARRGTGRCVTEARQPVS